MLSSLPRVGSWSPGRSVISLAWGTGCRGGAYCACVSVYQYFCVSVCLHVSTCVHNACRAICMQVCLCKCIHMWCLFVGIYVSVCACVPAERTHVGAHMWSMSVQTMYVSVCTCTCCVHICQSSHVVHVCAHQCLCMCVQVCVCVCRDLTVLLPHLVKPQT